MNTARTFRLAPLRIAWSRFLTVTVLGSVIGIAASSEPARAQLAKRTLEVDLGSGAIAGPLPFDEPFYVTAPAPASLLEVRLWTAAEADLPRSRCPALRPRETDPARGRYSVWRRRTELGRAELDSVMKFIVEAGPLAPNTDYTFCFHLIRRPTEEQAAAFISRAVAGITREMRQMATEPPNTVKQLLVLQGALIAALPAADSIDYGGPNSVFVRLESVPAEQQVAHLNRINRLVNVWFTQAFGNRQGNIRNAEWQADEASRALLSLARTPALARLQAVSTSAAQTRADLERFAGAGRLATDLTGFLEGPTTRVARGIHPVDGDVELIAFRDTVIWESAALRPYLDNLEQSRDRLGDVRDVVRAVRGRPSLMKRAGVSRSELNDLDEKLTSAIRALGHQSHNLSLIAADLDGIDAGIRALVADVRTYDLARIALHSTTSGTYKARANTYISLDAGFLGAWGVRRVVPYLGVNLYLRPVNKEAPLSLCEEGCFRRRFSLTAGITGSIAEDGRTDDLFAGRSLFLGAGYRLTDYWRVTGGALLLRSHRDEPRRRLRMNAAPAAATSIDIDVVGLLGKAGSALFP